VKGETETRTVTWSVAEFIRNQVMKFLMA